MAKDKKPVEEFEDKEALHRQIPPNAQDQKMFLWLESLFDVTDRENQPGEPKSTPDAFPDKIVLKPVFGHGGLDMGEQLRELAFKPMQQSVPNRESLVAMSNELRRIAQNHCNSENRRQRFKLYAFSNLRSADPIAVYLFTLVPTGRELGSNNLPASDSDDTHRDRLLEVTLAHSRWQQEQQAETMTNMLRLQNEIIQQQRTEISQMSAERRAMIVAQEDALSRKQEREERAEWAKMKNQLWAEGLQFVKGFGPSIQMYLTQGKVGIAEGLQHFLQGLTDEIKQKLFGAWDAAGNLLAAGILDKPQVEAFVALVDGSTNAATPAKVQEFMTSLRPEQLAAAQQVLPGDKIQILMTIAKAASDITERQVNGAS